MWNCGNGQYTFIRGPATTTLKSVPIPILPTPEPLEDSTTSTSTPDYVYGYRPTFAISTSLLFTTGAQRSETVTPSPSTTSPSAPPQQQRPVLPPWAIATVSIVGLAATVMGTWFGYKAYRKGQAESRRPQHPSQHSSQADIIPSFNHQYASHSNQYSSHGNQRQYVNVVYNVFHRP